MFKRLVVWFSLCAFLFTQTSVYAQSSHDQGVTSGTSANTSIRGLVNTPSASTVVPGYTTTPPETAYTGRPSLGADVNAKLAACATTPTDVTCQALLSAINSASTPRPAISPSDPSVLAASRIYRNPSTDLGSLSAYYTGCTTAEVTSPPRTENRICSRYVGVGSYSCSNRLTVGVSRSTNCTPGDWFAHAQSGSTGLDAQCIPQRPDTSQHFRVTEGASPLAFFDVDMTVSPVMPQRVAGVPRFAGDTTSVYVANRSCTTTTCNLTALIAEDERTVCTGSWDSPVCETHRPFLPVYSSCPAGTQSGDNLSYDVCTGSGDGMSCTTAVLDITQCYAPSASGVFATDTTGTYPPAWWSPSSGRSVVGWSPNPAFGPIPSMTLSYTKATADSAFTDTWNSQCPTLGAGGRCSVASSPVCVDGPSAKIIDGVSVTRACWEYQSTLSCSSTVTSDQCAPLVATGCTPLTSTCAQTNAGTGACEVFRDAYSCPVPGETVTTATNCPTNVFCVGGGCFNTSYTNDADFGRTMSMLEAAREAGVYLDTDRMQVFKGDAMRCRNRLLTNCCGSDPAGAGMTNQSVFGSGSRLVYDILMNSENRQFIYQGLSAMLTGAGFSGSFTSYGVTIAVNGTALPAGSTVLYSSSSVAGEGFVVAFDPWTLVIVAIIYVILSLTSCNEEEARLDLREGARVCHTIGSYCSSCFRILGVCVSCIERTTGKCCFNSMLARIVNEQGRVQIARGWGDARNPDCSGFTVAQLQTLNFAAMDFTEFYASLVPSSPDLGALQSNNSSRIPACYYGQGRCRP